MDLQSRIDARAKDIETRLIETRRHLHRRPELSGREFETAEFVATRLDELGLEVQTGIARTGVVGLLRGGKPGPTLAYRADMDALPIQEENQVEYASGVPGVMHACGHDVHTAIGLGVAEVLSGLASELTGSVKFIFQPAEEGAPAGESGGAAQMVQEGVLECPKVEAIFGMHVNPLLEVGKVSYCSGPMAAAADAFEIAILGTMAHGAYPWLGVDPVLVGAHVVAALQGIVSRQVDARDAVVVSVCVFQSGNRHNIIPDRARLAGTVRTFEPQVREQVREAMERVVKGVCDSFGASYQIGFPQPGLPVTVNDAALTERVRPVLARVVGEENLLLERPHTGSEDFSFFAQAVPGFYYWLGIRNADRGIIHPGHSPRFDVDEACLPLGVRLSAAVLTAVSSE